MIRLPLPVAVATFILFASYSSPVRAADPLVFCLAGGNLPFSATYPPRGIDVDLAHAIGAHLDREVEFVWQSIEEESPEAALRAKRCDATMGAIVDPGEMAERSQVPGLALTQPYYRACYRLIHKPSTASPTSLADVGEARIGVDMTSIPIYTLKQHGYRVYALADTEAVVEAVADGRVRYGYAWGPHVGWLLLDREDVVLAKGLEPEECWQFAIAVRDEDRALREALAAAIEQLVASGQAQKMFASHGILYMPPVKAAAGH